MKQSRSAVSIEIAEQRHFWNSWNARYREGNRKLPEWSLRQARMVVEWLVSLGKTDLDILEIGCGSGWLCQQLVAFGRVTGTDLSDEVLARSEADLKTVSFVAGDFFALDFPSSSLDVIVSLEVLAHVADQNAFFAKIALLLRPGGHLMLATQNRFVLERWTRVPMKEAGQIRNWVDVKTLRQLLSNHFEIAELTSIVPVGDRGILRWINAPKVNRMLSVVASRPRIEALKERLFLGHTLMALARKPTQQALN